MNNKTTFLLIAVTTLTLILTATMQSKAQSKSYAGVIPFVAGNDRVGFFDQSIGRVYIYDTNMSKCTFAGQLTVLGKPIQAMVQ